MNRYITEKSHNHNLATLHYELMVFLWQRFLLSKQSGQEVGDIMIYSKLIMVLADWGEFILVNEYLNLYATEPIRSLCVKKNLSKNCFKTHPCPLQKMTWVFSVKWNETQWISSPRFIEYQLLGKFLETCSPYP